jgi:uncharacterized protein
MLYNVASILKEHIGATREIDIDDDMPVDGRRVHLTGHARLDRTPRGILVRATMHGTHEDQCSRCLRPTSTPIDITMEEEFIPIIDVDSGVRVEMREGEEDAFRINTRHELDLREPLAQYWAMALPMAPVCADKCAGLCPRCGREATGGHLCNDQPVDERWAKLARLKAP